MKPRINLLWCLINGHDFSERWEKKDPYKGEWYVVERGKRCACCDLCDVDNSGSLALYKIKEDRAASAYAKGLQ